MIIIIIQLHVFSVTYSLVNGLFVIKVMFVFIFMQPGTDIQEVLKGKTFSEPRLIIFVNKSNPSLSLAQGFIAAENELLFEIDNFFNFRRNYLTHSHLLLLLYQLPKVAASSELPSICSGDSFERKSREWCKTIF